MLFRSMSFVAEAQFVLLLLSKTERVSPAALLVPVLIISSLSCQTLNVLFTNKPRLTSVLMQSPVVHIQSSTAVCVFLLSVYSWLVFGNALKWQNKTELKLIQTWAIAEIKLKLNWTEFGLCCTKSEQMYGLEQ